MTDQRPRKGAPDMTESIDVAADLRALIRSAPGHYDSPSVRRAVAEIERLRAQVAKLRGLLWYGWHEMNAIRARSGVPLDERGSKQSISEEYWDAVVEAMNEALGDDAKPWPSDDANAALKETER